MPIAVDLGAPFRIWTRPELHRVHLEYDDSDPRLSCLLGLLMATSNLIPFVLRTPIFALTIS